MTGAPLLDHAPGATVLEGPAGPVDREGFIGRAAALAEHLPERRYAVHLCEDHHRFLLGFAAAQMRGQTTLLPPNRAPATLAALLRDYPDCYALTDRPGDAPGLPEVAVAPEPARRESEAPAIDRDHVAAIPFTSGSTGTPTPHPKRWGDLRDGSRRVLDRFGIAPGTTLVATIPAQHMFGLEMSVVLPLVGALAVTAGRPFFPGDFRDALARIPAPRALITTPFHLRALVAEATAWPDTDFLLSATAPLDAALAARAEAAFAAPVHEVFGSTETGAIASRRPAAGDRWHLLDGLALHDDGAGATVTGLGTGGTALGDTVTLHSPQTFTFHGRDDDMVKIAGKRASLAGLNRELLRLDGVEDAAFVQTEEWDGRLAALVVAPDRTEAELITALRQRIDPAFLPRPLVRVPALPRNATGKLPRDAVLPLLRGTEETP